MSTRRSSKHSKTRKTKRTKKTAITAINVKSEATGITHVFPDVEVFEKLLVDLEQKVTLERTLALGRSIQFWNWLSGRSLISEPTYTLESEIYRICFDGYDPLEVSGSLACGGRFNVGGAQKSTSFPTIEMAACVYGADTEKWAMDEAGSLIRSPELYKLKPIKPLLLWDLSVVINELDDQMSFFDFPDLISRL